MKFIPLLLLYPSFVYGDVVISEISGASSDRLLKFSQLGQPSLGARVYRGFHPILTTQNGSLDQPPLVLGMAASLPIWLPILRVRPHRCICDIPLRFLQVRPLRWLI